MSEPTLRTPPQIVQASDDPAAALSAFIGQELEHWGFTLGRSGHEAGSERWFRVFPPGRELGQTLIVKVTVPRQ